MLSTFRARLVALAGALLLVATTAGPAQAAVSQADASGDLTWYYSGSIAKASKAERARLDITKATWAMGDVRVVARTKVRNWSANCTTGVPCSNTHYATDVTFTNADSSRTVKVQAYRGTGGFPSGSRVFWSTRTNSGFKCTTGQVRWSANSTSDVVAISAPKSCFPKGWRLRNTNIHNQYEYRPVMSNANRYRLGYDTTDGKAIDWVPNPA